MSTTAQTCHADSQSPPVQAPAEALRMFDVFRSGLAMAFCIGFVVCLAATWQGAKVYFDTGDGNAIARALDGAVGAFSFGLAVCVVTVLTWSVLEIIQRKWPGGD